MKNKSILTQTFKVFYWFGNGLFGENCATIFYIMIDFIIANTTPIQV